MYVDSNSLSQFQNAFEMYIEFSKAIFVESSTDGAHSDVEHSTMEMVDIAKSLELIKSLLQLSTKGLKCCHSIAQSVPSGIPLSNLPLNAILFALSSVFITLTSTSTIFFSVFMQKKVLSVTVQITDTYPPQLKKKILIPKKENATLPKELTHAISFVESAFNVNFADDVNFQVTDGISVLQITMSVEPIVVALCLDNDEFILGSVTTWFNAFTNSSVVQTYSVSPSLKKLPRKMHLVLADSATPRDFLAEIKSKNSSTKVILITYENIICEKPYDQIVNPSSLSILQGLL